MAESTGVSGNARSRRTGTALLAAAREIIEESGVEAMTMAAVAERAGVSRRGAYLHFSSRGDLLSALFRYVNETEALDDSVRRVWGCPDAVSAVEEWAHHLARYHPRVLAIARGIDRARRRDPDAAQHWDTIMRDWLGGTRRLMRWLADEGRLRPNWTVEAAAQMLWALMSFDVLEGLLVDQGWSPHRYATHMAALFRATFVTDG